MERLAEEQAALRRVAVLVAQQPSPSEVFTAVTQAVGLLLDADLAVLHVFPGDGTATTIASWSGDGPVLPIGTRFPLDGDNLAARIFESGAPARMYGHDEAWEREATDLARSLRLRSAVGAPILVEGKLWGALMAATRRVEPWAENAETRIAAFTELVATTIANAESREALAELADEQAALRRVATLVAQGTSPQDLFDAVAEEVGRLFHVASATMGRFEPDDSVTTVASWSTAEVAFPTGRRWPTEGTNVAWMVLQTGRPARIDDFSAATDPIGVAAREAGYKSAVGSPIVVEEPSLGRHHGYLDRQGRCRPDTEARLASFTELVATAIANSQAHEQIAQLADEQAALRRVATLVAQDVQPSVIFSAVSAEVSRLFDAGSTILRYERDGPAVVFVAVAKFDFPVGTRWEFQEGMASAEVYRTGRPARVDDVDWSSGSGTLAAAVRRLGVVSTVATPIVVEGRLWGAMTVHSTDEVLPRDTEDRLANFSQLVATAIANAESRTDLAASEARAHDLATEQAALRRVATLVARGGGPEPVFRAVADETVALMGCDTAAIVRFERDGTATVMGGHNARRTTGERIPLDPHYVVAAVRKTGKAARFDTDDPAAEGMPEPVRAEGTRSALASPIVVDGELWGAIAVGSLEHPLPAIAERRLADFTDLVATAVANAHSGQQVRALADEQAALRRVATLVAHAAPSTEVFDAVATEVGKLLDIDITVLGRYDGDGTATAIGSWSSAPEVVPVGSRFVLGGRNVLTIVAETARPARLDGYDDATGETGEFARRTAGDRRSRRRSSSRADCGASCSPPLGGRSRFRQRRSSGSPRSLIWLRPRWPMRKPTTRSAVSATSNPRCAALRPW